MNDHDDAVRRRSMTTTDHHGAAGPNATVLARVDRARDLRHRRVGPDDRPLAVDAGPTGDHGRRTERGRRSPCALTDASRGGWLGIGTLDPKSRATTTEVVDEGSVWRFRLTAGPDELGEITRTEQQLRAADWTLTIPADAADRLPELRRTL